MLNQISVAIPAYKTTAYPLLINSGLLDKDLSWLPKNPSQLVIITDHTVKKYYAQFFVKALKREGHTPLLLSFPAGEKSKTIHIKNKLENAMLRQRCDRETLILALGGG